MPDWKDAIRAQLAGLNLAPAREAEIIEELAQHCEDRCRELESGGATASEARRIALEEVSGNELLARELSADDPPKAREPIVFGGGFIRDIRYGFRSLRASPGLTLVIIAVLGIGIGATVAMFTVVDAAFLRPLRLPEPERLVQVQETSSSGDRSSVAYPNFVDWERRNRSFESMGVVSVAEETLKRAGGNERVQVGYVSPGFHRTYGIQAAAGRLLTEADNRPAAEPAAVLSHSFWQTHFAGDPSAIGRTITVDDQVFTIAGVTAPFQWHSSAAVFVPIAFGFNKWGLNLREQRSNTGVVARLRPGATLEQARTEMKVIAAQLAREHPGTNGGRSAIVAPLREYIGGGMRQSVLLLFGAVALVLLIGCGNVAGLLLARAAVRQREIAIRTALGARRLQLVRQLLTESLLLALGGAAAGVAVARFSLAGLLRIFPRTENLGGIGLDARVLAFSILLAVLTAVLFGLAPAVQLARSGVAEALKAGGRGSRGGALRLRTRKLLVVGQVALAVVLSIGAGLLARSMIQALETDPGFRPERVVVVRLVPPVPKNADFASNGRFFREVSERLAGAPGVQAVGAVDALPFGNPDSSAEFHRDDRPVPPPGQLPTALKATVTPGFFHAMGIPLLRGRLFDASDGRMPPLKRDINAVLAYIRSREFVTVINETMARRFWPGEDPVGKAFRFGPRSLKGPRVIIVGVVGDARQFGLDRPVQPQFFFSSDQFPPFYANFVIRTTQDTAGTAALIRGVVHECQPDAVVARIEPMTSVIGRTLTGRRDNLMLLGLFSGIALLLAAVGLYATMTYIVSQRTQEIGVRMALGANAAQVRVMVVREGAMLAAAGVAVGIVAALAGARVVSSMLYGIRSTDAATYTGSAVLLGAIMLVASYVPAWRASRVDPMVTLRFE